MLTVKNKLWSLSYLVLCIFFNNLCFAAATFPPELKIIVEKYKHEPYLRRIDMISQYFLGKPYGFLAYENEQVSGDIEKKFYGLMTNHEFMYEFETLDCVTYVENVLALSNLKEIDEIHFSKALKNIRYKSGVDKFLFRNHFHSIDWLPNNRNHLRDITKKIAKKYKISKTEINRLAWVYHLKIVQAYKALQESQNKPFTEATLKKELAKQKIFLPLITALIPYVETQEILSKYDDYVKKFPLLSIVHIIRPQWDLTASIGTYLDVSHLGFVIKKNNELLFRHANSEDGKVVELSFKDYLQKISSSTTIKGINIAEIR